MRKLFIVLFLMFLVVYTWFNYSSKTVGYVYNPITHADDYLSEKKAVLNLVTFNTLGNVDKAFQYFSRLGIKFVIGPSMSTDGMKILPYLKKYKMLSISPTISSTKLLNSGYFYSLTPSNLQIIDVFKKYLKLFEAKRILLVLDDNNREYADEFKSLLNVFEGNYVYYDDVSSLFSIEISQFDTVILTTIGTESAKIVKYIRTKDDDVRIIVSEAAFTPEFLSLGGSVVANTYAIVPSLSVRNTETELIEECERLLTDHRFLSIEQMKRFLSRSIINTREGYLYFTPDGISQKIGLYKVIEGQFKEVFLE
ncbi:ABC transporter substrate-binding protein [Fervidobacterium gondwanense]|uniref:Amino acid/amide ABC transporter substrate-binding protein, HAAT family n=1 Tax=Fervidobacterium gondwanense DSM 13020 TaxID=1121883 RepID=A0A1M7S7I0_FERGO|nr:ABC transporter substrate-binding protein [Fervidobacterium gondwanense]SHN54403.1 amino acid/amide ABC transporter substrate-binding protein, HAAT family [Fervidobacterium gondwanense DSM 13020]